MTDRFEHELSALLGHRADGLDVHGDLPSLLVRAGQSNPTGANGARGSNGGDLDGGAFTGGGGTGGGWDLSRYPMVLAAAAVAVLGMIGFRLLSEAGAVQEQPVPVTPTEPTGQTEPGQGRFQPDQQVIVWLEVDAEPATIAEISDWLQQNPSVSSARFVGRGETHAEFLQHFADEPEIVELVEPGQLPLSFEVTTENPETLERDLTNLFDAVAAVETADSTTE